LPGSTGAVAAAPHTHTHYHDSHPSDDDATIAMDYTAAAMHPYCQQSTSESTGSRRNTSIMSTDDVTKELTLAGTAAPQARSRCLLSNCDQAQNCYSAGKMLLSTARHFELCVTSPANEGDMHHGNEDLHAFPHESFPALEKKNEASTDVLYGDLSPSVMEAFPPSGGITGPIPTTTRYTEVHELTNSFTGATTATPVLSTRRNLLPLPVDFPPPSLEEWEELIDLARFFLE